MKIKRKGKVYPSPSSSSSYKDAISVLKLLPAAIVALALSLPVQDREVLAYMITRSMTTTNPPSTLEHQKNKCKRPTTNVQKHPLFECGCFDCYTSFWFRWDSSPNRELIHQAIEAFEDHLTHDEFSKRNGRGRKRDKVLGRRDSQKQAFISGKEPETIEISVPESDVMVEVEAEDVKENEDEKVGEVTRNFEMEVVAATVKAPASNHKGLARKVLPDVVGLLNSRLWNLWSPNS